VINWDQSVDNDTMLTLDLQANVMTKIKEYSGEAETLLTKYVQGHELVCASKLNWLDSVGEHEVGN
jgi:hypothetical protein